MRPGRLKALSLSPSDANGWCGLRYLARVTDPPPVMPLLLFSAEGSNHVGGHEDASRLVMIGTVEGAVEPGLAGGPAPWPVLELALLIHRNAGELHGGERNGPFPCPGSGCW